MTPRFDASTSRRTLRLGSRWGAARPVREMHGPDECRRIGRECPVAEHCAEVARLLVRDYFARVAGRLQSFADELVEVKLLGAGHFHGPVYGCAYGHVGECL